MTIKTDCAKYKNGSCGIVKLGDGCAEGDVVCVEYKPTGSTGRKFDHGKIRWDLFPWDEAEDIVKVLMKGSEKYEDFNWQKVPDAETRYFAAAIRHLLAHRRGERIDPETGLPHLSHLGCCVLFLAWFDNQKKGRIK